jgi:hypothetical protein
VSEASKQRAAAWNATYSAAINRASLQLRE